MSLEDKNILITGATSGIGKHSAFFLAEKKANIILIGRNIKKLKQITDRINSLNPNNKGKFFYADLSLQSDIAKVFNDINSNYKTIDILINNAGAIFSKRQMTSEGIEKTFALNHMGYFSLTKLILGIIDKNKDSRIINVASAAHKSGKIDFNDLFIKKKYGVGWRSYAQSKLCNVLFTYQLSRLLSSTKVTVNCLHPGLVNTNFGNNNSFLFSSSFKLVKFLYGINEKKGSETINYLASDNQKVFQTGGYFVKNKKTISSKISQSIDFQQKLWDISEEIFYKLCKP
ncbi:MAG: short-chain dehydrogenase [Rhodospirillaceae bacterium]|nr:short-chain dehydrogenase [Rhodospirillaceae bacterium]|tara:strand:+ start:396 stop:1256 length:861 start_codon:yes stop_codon:yes gene_type:complete